MEKTCSKCGTSKEVFEFYKAAANLDGLQTHCKKCDNFRKTLYCRKKSVESGKKRRTLTLDSRMLRAQGLKRCPKCTLVKQLKDFYTSGKSNSGHSVYCGLCMNTTTLARPNLVEECKTRYKKTKNQIRDSYLKHKFGITQKDYEAMLISQDGVCAICGKTDKNKRLAIDHCHKTGKVRSLLCGSCNPAVGFIKESPEIARKIAVYLDKHKGVTMGYIHVVNLYAKANFLEKAGAQVYALEKIHGTSANITMDKGKITFFAGGESHVNFLKLFDAEKLNEDLRDEVVKRSLDDNFKITIYGEAYGGKCQKMKDTYGDKLKFVAFDVDMNGTWLTVPEAETLCKTLGLEFVSYELVPNNLEALNTQRDRPSVQAERNGMGTDKVREGIVIKPCVEMLDEFNSRLIVKHKGDAFKETATSREVDPTKLQVLNDATAIAVEWVVPERLHHVMDKLTSTLGSLDMRATPKVLDAMVEDVKREAAGEIVWSPEAEQAIKNRTRELFKKHVTAIKTS